MIFILSGFEKVISPHQNFVFVIEQYELVSAQTAVWIAQGLPWVELIFGVFFLLGLQTRIAAAGLMVMFVVFVGVVGQALLRGLPMDECGCFGEWIHVPPKVIICLDAVSFLVVARGWMFDRFGKWGIDALYE